MRVQKILPFTVVENCQCCRSTFRKLQVFVGGCKIHLGNTYGSRAPGYMYNGQDMPIIRVIYVLESAEAGERWQPLGYQQVRVPLLFFFSSYSLLKGDFLSSFAFILTKTPIDPLLALI